MTEVIVILVIVALLVAGVGMVAWMMQRDAENKRQAREQFGSEYHAARARYGDSDRTVKELRNRQERVESYNLRPLPANEARRYEDEWRMTQGRFVDDPPAAIADADRLVTQVMKARGYPTGDFEQQSEDVSVRHGSVVENYRAAHDIAERQARGEADTEELRQAMVYYRSLFEELLERSPASTRR